MSSAELQKRIQLGEDSSLELKEARFSGNRVVSPHRDGLADELAAFANSHGGTCVIGVEDHSKKVLGVPLELLDTLESFVATLCNDSIEPPLPVAINKVSLPTGEGSEAVVLRVDVSRSIFVHRSPGGYLYRIGSSRRVMTPDYLSRLFQQRSQARLLRFDEQIVPDTTIDDLEPGLWQRFQTPRSDPSREAFLHKLAMARRDEDSAWRPTVTGVLLGAIEPKRWLPNAFIQAIAYRGTVARPTTPGDVYQLDAADFTGPVDQQILDACHFVFRNMRVEATKNVGRRDVPQYSMSAVFEAIVNAAAHRDYSMYGSKIRLRLFSDRLELYSPGPLANTMEVDSLPYRQVSRNEALVSLLARIPIPASLTWLTTERTAFMDRRGEGVGLLLDESEQLSGRRPEFKMLDDSELLLTIFAASAATTP